MSSSIYSIFKVRGPTNDRVIGVICHLNSPKQMFYVICCLKHSSTSSLLEFLLTTDNFKFLSNWLAITLCGIAAQIKL